MVHFRQSAIIAVLVLTAALGLPRKPASVVNLTRLLEPDAANAQVVSAQVTKVVILVRGIDVNQDSITDLDPYGEAIATFGNIIGELCRNTSQPQPGPTPQAQRSTPLVQCGENMAWIPFSYQGVDSNGIPSPFRGIHTGQDISLSSAYMDQIVQTVRRQPEATTAAIDIVGHSLGGAVAAYWAANNRDVRVITLDSPVSGITNADNDVMEV
jgi:hypothetical protein